MAKLTQQSDDEGTHFSQVNRGEYGSLTAMIRLHDGASGSGSPIDDPSSEEDISYWELLCHNSNFRYFILSYLITHLGEWLTYVASIDMIEQSRREHHQTTSRMAISILVVVRLLPNVLLSASIGGSLADSLDRRRLLIWLDLAGALCAVLFVAAFQWKSIGALYAASFLQQCVAGVYAPSHSAMIPQLVSTDGALKKATTLEGLTWSAMQAFGAAASGWIVDAVGIRLCFILDGVTYLASAGLLWLVRGTYNVADATASHTVEEHDDEGPTSKPEPKPGSPWQKLQSMTVDGMSYLWESYFGALVFVKGTAALAYGACDVLNVAFAEEGTVDSDQNSNRKLGILFSLVGIGCLLGPILAEPFLHVDRPSTLQVSCVVGFGLSTIGYFGWAWIPQFEAIAFFAILRAAGSSNIWIHSTLLLQKFSTPALLGRVLAMDYAIALICEALAACVCGVVMDQRHWSSYQVSWILAVLSTLMTVGWGWYHLSGQGAGQYKVLLRTSNTKM